MQFLDERFTETRSEVLRAAADGDWSEFFQQYLKPCWREVVIGCRQRNLDFAAGDDIFQDFVLRVLRDGKFGAQARTALLECGKDPSRRDNLPARYLAMEKTPLGSVRFRTYLKAVVRNIVLEFIRAKSKQPEPLEVNNMLQHQIWIDRSVTLSIDRHWIVMSLETAARRLRAESNSAKTKGKRRWFDILYNSVVSGMTQEAIAQKLGLDASTVSELTKDARTHFVALLHDTTGIQDLVELKDTVARAPHALRSAFENACDDNSVFNE